jgi:osmotically inducible lipoprotein OsmB
MTRSLAILGLLALAACGTSTTDRALSGGALGAGGGFLLGGTSGALLGGGAGATAGALTKDSDINLGKPIWKR